MFREGIAPPRGAVVKQIHCDGKALVILVAAALQACPKNLALHFSLCQNRQPFRSRQGALPQGARASEVPFLPR